MIDYWQTRSSGFRDRFFPGRGGGQSIDAFPANAVDQCRRGWKPRSPHPPRCRLLRVTLTYQTPNNNAKSVFVDYAGFDHTTGYPVNVDFRVQNAAYSVSVSKRTCTGEYWNRFTRIVHKYKTISASVNRKYEFKRNASCKRAGLFFEGRESNVWTPSSFARVLTVYVIPVRNVRSIRTCRETPTVTRYRTSLSSSLHPPRHRTRLSAFAQRTCQLFHYIIY